jgi:hypothetical protein
MKSGLQIGAAPASELRREGRGRAHVFANAIGVEWLVGLWIGKLQAGRHLVQMRWEVSSDAAGAYATEMIDAMVAFLGAQVMPTPDRISPGLSLAVRIDDGEARISAPVADAAQKARVSTPKVGSKHRQRWEATWRVIRDQVQRNVPHTEISDWLNRTHKHLKAGPDTVTKIARAGLRGELGSHQEKGIRNSL